MSPGDPESSRFYLAVHICGWGLEPEGHRTVLDQRYLHIRAESPRRHGPVGGLCPLEKMGEQPSGVLRWGCGAEARSGAFLGISSERELRYQQEAALDVAQREIHPPLLIGEDAVGE